jgi:hypothetical protein
MRVSRRIADAMDNERFFKVVLIVAGLAPVGAIVLMFAK